MPPLATLVKQMYTASKPNFPPSSQESVIYTTVHVLKFQYLVNFVIVEYIKKRERVRQQNKKVHKKDASSLQRSHLPRSTPA